MSNIRTLQRAFNGGILSPEMHGMIADAKYQAGLAECENFVVRVQGPAENRAGFAFVREVKDSTKKTRLIEFTYSTTQTMAIEMGAGYFRFHTNGATLLQPAGSAWVSGGGPWAVGAVVTDGGIKYYCKTYHNVDHEPPNSTYWYPMPATGEYEIPNPYAEADLFDIHYVQSADVLTLVHPNYPPMELRRYGATDWRTNIISFAAPLSPPTGLTVTPYIPGSAAVNTDTYTHTYYSVTAIAADGTGESAACTAVYGNNNLYVTGAKNTISWTAVSGASYYNVYKMQGGLYGYIGQTDGTSIVDDNIAPDLSTCPPVYDSVFSGSGDYPGAVTYFEQRRCFAGTINEPQNIAMTKSGTESNMSYSLPIRDDDRIKFRVAAREANTIRHMVSISQLILLTSSSEWRVSSVNSDAITPTSISVKPQSYVGASNAQPVIVNNTLIYGAARGGHVRELAYNWQASGFITGDLSLRTPHLFDGYSIADMAYAKAPQPVVWFISSSGRLLGLTYVPEQQVGAWHQHKTDGIFESCCVVAEGDEDVLYAIVKRTINNYTVRYIERMASRAFADPVDAFFVDCGLTYSGAKNTTLALGTGADVQGATGVAMVAGAASFSPGDVGKYIQARYLGDDGEYHTARALITVTADNTHAICTIERPFPSLDTLQANAWGVTATTISGLDHLEGETVSILADGAVHPQRVVSSGAITLDNPALVAHIGLPITADLQTLPMAAQIDGSFGQGRIKNVNKVWLRVLRSSGIFVGPDASSLVEAKQRTTEIYGEPPSLKTDEIDILVHPNWQNGGQICVRQVDPLPVTIVSMSTEVALGG